MVFMMSNESDMDFELRAQWANITDLSKDERAMKQAREELGQEADPRAIIIRAQEIKEAL